MENRVNELMGISEPIDFTSDRNFIEKDGLVIVRLESWKDFVMGVNDKRIVDLPKAAKWYINEPHHGKPMFEQYMKENYMFLLYTPKGMGMIMRPITGGGSHEVQVWDHEDKMVDNAAYKNKISSMVDEYFQKYHATK